MDDNTGGNWKLIAGLAAVLYLLSGYFALNAQQGFSTQSYGAGVKGLPSQRITGEAALRVAEDSQVKAICFVGGGSLVLIIAVVMARKGM